MCVGGVLPRAGDRGNRRERREDAEQKEEGRKEGRTKSLDAEKWTEGGGRDKKDRKGDKGRERARVNGGCWIPNPLLSLSSVRSAQKRERYNDPLCCLRVRQWHFQHYGLDQSVILFEVLLHRPV